MPHVQRLAWQFTEGGGRIVGGLVAIGGDAAGVPVRMFREATAAQMRLVIGSSVRLGVVPRNGLAARL